MNHPHPTVTPETADPPVAPQQQQYQALLVKEEKEEGDHRGNDVGSTRSVHSAATVKRSNVSPGWAAQVRARRTMADNLNNNDDGNTYRDLREFIGVESTHASRANMLSDCNLLVDFADDARVSVRDLGDASNDQIAQQIRDFDLYPDLPSFI